MNSATKKLLLALLTVAIASMATVSTAAAESSLDQELEEYWATEREMPVMQDRLFEREGRFEVGVRAGLLISEPFFHYYPVGAGAGYHVSNNFGVELSGAFMDAGPLTQDDELMEFLKENRGDAGFDPVLDTTDRYLWRANAMALWSPFYGKLAALQQKLIHFDINFGAGLGVAGMERPDVNRQVAETAITPEFVLGVGVHFYIHNNVAIRVDGRGYLHRGAVLPTNQDSFFQQLNFPMETQLGVSYLF